MNRLELLANELASESASHQQVDFARVHSVPPGRDCSLFVPMHYERNYAYPLVVWLHSPGDDERQLQRVMPLISMRNYVASGPRGVIAARPRGFAWGERDECVLSAEQRVFDSIESAERRCHVAPRRIFLAGYEQGGTMAIRIALRNAARFAGVLSLGGPFPLRRSPLIRLNEARALPLFIAQGRDSEQYPVERTCEELRLFHAAGLSVTLRQYPCGDELNTQMLLDMDRWMMELVTGTSSA